MRRLLFMLIIGLGGAAILISLGVWQMQRLSWKQAVIADIEARIVAPPTALPEMPDPARDAYLPVSVSGEWRGAPLRVLVSQKRIGAGYRLIQALETADGDVLVDRGFILTDTPLPADLSGTAEVTGNLQWPQETDGFTPAPDAKANLWFAREVGAMAAELKTRPVLIVARTVSQQGPTVTPLPVDTAAIPNDHLQYAITWFSLAAIWLLMTTLFLRRRAGPDVKD